MRIEFGQKPSREPNQPTEQQIANANLGAVRSDSRVGQAMIRGRNSTSTTAYEEIFIAVRDGLRDKSKTVLQRARTIARDAAAPAAVIGGTVGIGLLLGACGPDGVTDGGGGTDGGQTGDLTPAQQAELIKSYCQVNSLDQSVDPQCPPKAGS